MSKPSPKTKPPTPLELVVGLLPELVRYGVRVLEVGEGAGRVRLELDPDLLPVHGSRGSVRASVPGPRSDPERADDPSSASPPSGGTEQAEDDLDTAHL